MIYTFLVDRIPGAPHILWTLLSHLPTPVGAQKLITSFLYFIGKHRTLMKVLLGPSYWSAILDVYSLLVLYPVSITKSGCKPFCTRNPIHLTGISTALATPLGRSLGEVPLSYLVCRAQLCLEFTMKIHTLRAPIK